MRVRSFLGGAVASALLAALAAPATAALSDAQKCEAAVELGTAKYAQCRLKAESKFTKTGDAARLASSLASCAGKLTKAYDNAFVRWGGSCPATEPVAAFDAYLTQCTVDVEAAAAGATFPACGDGALNTAGEQCDGADLGGESCASLGFLGGALGCDGGCAFDTSACQATLCGNGTVDGAEQCDGVDLAGASCASLGYTLGGSLGCDAGCGYDTSGCASQAFPATGQTTAYTADKNDGIPGAVAVADDGTVQAGATLAFVDNGDGTITDLNTGLMWEKKSDDGGLHDKDNVYRWSGDGSQETIWDWLDDVNAEGGTGFAGYNDWRIPNKKELESIVDVATFSPAVSAEFNTACAPACTVLTCSCTVSDTYWSSSTYAFGPTFAWFVNFFVGNVFADSKSTNFYVRAVRAGS